MMKKEYISPELLLTFLETQTFIAATQFSDPTKDEQNLTPTDDPYDGEFHARRHNNIWDDEEEQEDQY